MKADNNSLSEDVSPLSTVHCPDLFFTVNHHTALTNSIIVPAAFMCRFMDGKF